MPIQFVCFVRLKKKTKKNKTKRAEMNEMLLLALSLARTLSLYGCMHQTAISNSHLLKIIKNNNKKKRIVVVVVVVDDDVDVFN